MYLSVCLSEISLTLFSFVPLHSLFNFHSASDPDQVIYDQKKEIAEVKNQEDIGPLIRQTVEVSSDK